MFFSSVWVWQQWPDSRLHLVFCDVGQGDGAIVVLGAFQAVVDTGAYEDRMVQCLSKNTPFWDRKIEVIFLSHADKDHAGALPGIRKRYVVQKIVDHPHIKDIVRYGNLSFDIIKGSEPVVTSVTGGGSESNESSVVMRMVYVGFSALFTGDLHEDSELALVEMGVLRKTDVLKVSHHGSKYGSGKEFLDRLRPKLAVISVGEKNNYGHPNGDALIRLEVVGAKILRTDKMGMVSILSDGKTMEVFREK